MDNVIINKIYSMESQLIKEYNTIPHENMEERIYLSKNLESLTVFKELLTITKTNNNQPNDLLVDLFCKVTNNYIISCKVQNYIERSSWVIDLAIYKSLIN